VASRLGLALGKVVGKVYKGLTWRMGRFVPFVFDHHSAPSTAFEPRSFFRLPPTHTFSFVHSSLTRFVANYLICRPNICLVVQLDAMSSIQMGEFPNPVILPNLARLFGERIWERFRYLG